MKDINNLPAEEIERLFEAEIDNILEFDADSVLIAACTSKCAYSNWYSVAKGCSYISAAYATALYVCGCK